MPTYRLKFVEEVTYEVTITTDEVFDVDSPETDDEGDPPQWFKAMEVAKPDWIKEGFVSVDDRVLIEFEEVPDGDAAATGGGDSPAL